MIEQFLRRMLRPDVQTEVAPDAPLALAALMVRLARSDGHFAEAERATILTALTTAHGLAPQAARDVLARAEALEAASDDTVRFTRALKEAVPLDSRVAVMESLWRVVLADGDRATSENQLMRLCADLLGVTDLQSNQARLRIGSA